MVVPTFDKFSSKMWHIYKYIQYLQKILNKMFFKTYILIYTQLHHYGVLCDHLCNWQHLATPHSLNVSSVLVLGMSYAG